MRKYLLFIKLVVLVFYFSAQAGAGELNKKEIKALHADIRSMYSAFEAGDPDLFIKKTHPSIYSMVGGKDNFSKTTKSAVSSLSSQGIVFISADLGKPTKLYTVGKEELCFVPRVSVMEVKGQKAKSMGFLIAIRKQGETKWSYLDGSGLRKDQSLLWKLFPNLTKDLNLPPNYIEML